MDVHLLFFYYHIFLIQIFDVKHVTEYNLLDLNEQFDVGNVPPHFVVFFNVFFEVFFDLLHEKNEIVCELSENLAF